MLKEKNSKIITLVAKTLRTELLKNRPSTRGLCFFASKELKNRLKEYAPRLAEGVIQFKCQCFGIKPENNPRGTSHVPGFESNHYHFWLELGRTKKILDITADQFNCEKFENFPEVIYSNYQIFQEYRLHHVSIFQEISYRGDLSWPEYSSHRNKKGLNGKRTTD